MSRWVCLVFCVVSIVACGGAPASLSVDGDLDEIPDASRSSLQMFIVLSPDPSAMGRPSDIKGMWAAVHGQDSAYAQIRQQVKWAPSKYELDVELDFGELPHPKLDSAFVDALIRQLPAQHAEAARGAKVAVFMRSNAGVLPDGNHIRLVGTAVLYAAEKYQGVILDLLARRAWTAADWRRELESSSLSAKQIRLVRRPGADGRVSLESRGNMKFGAPDLVMSGISPGVLADAQKDFVAVLEWLKKRGGGAGERVGRGENARTLGACDPQKHPGNCVTIVAPKD